MPEPISGGCGAGVADGGVGALLPASPFYAPRYHFGMLLGVDDFETEQAYHRGKVRLHNAWLHGEGVVWGLGVDLPMAGAKLRGEIRVNPGLALDAAGRELHLDAAACVDVAAWYQAQAQDPEMIAVAQVATNGAVTIPVAHVVARFSACAARPVPSIAEPCAEGGGTGVSCSRAQETVELLLIPGPPPPRYDAYPRLRLLFGLDPAREDSGEQPPWNPDGARNERQRILALAPADRPAAFLAAIRRFAALDEIDLRPAVSTEGLVTWFPADDDTRVTLARIDAIQLDPNGGGKLVLTSATVDNTVRPSHVATRTIQELLSGVCGCDGAPGGGGSPPPPPPPPPDAGGPRIDPASVELSGERVTMTATAALSRASVHPDAFSVSAYDIRDGWHAVEIREARMERNRRTVHLELDTGFGGNLVRVIAYGTGPRPLLGTGLVPLAGAKDGPAGGEDDGHDFVIMLKRSET